MPAHDTLAVRADVTRGADNQMIVEKALAAWGRLDVFFANAGVPQSPENVEDVDEAIFDRVVKDSASHTLFLCHSASSQVMLFPLGQPQRA